MFKAILVILFISSYSLHAQQSEAELQVGIENIQIKLKTLKQKLNNAYGKEKELIDELEHQDRVISSVSNQITESNLQLQEIIKEISEINEKIEISNHSIERQKNEITELLKLQIYLNHDKTLKMLLINPGNEADIQSKHRIKYLQNKLFNLIREVAVEIENLELLKSQREKLFEQENHKKEILEQQQAELLKQRKQRLEILNNLKLEIAKHETESETLNKDQQRLQQLLNEIQVLLSDLPKDLGLNKSFAQLRGQMKQPVDGKYIRSFNSQKSEDTRWSGVVIQSDFGNQVSAIAYGRVAFADWLRGFGMLVILDHQDGYMSLYGFNQSISVEAGDWVEERQQIATVGNSGDMPIPALYFEIRKDAIPQNPKNWVK